MRAYLGSAGAGFLALTVGGAGLAAWFWLGWDVAVLLTVEALTGLGLALSEGEPDDEISSI